MHRKLKLPPITTHITQQDNNHFGNKVGTNNLMYQDGNKEDTSNVASGRIKAPHGNIEVQHGTGKQPLGTRIKLPEPRHQLAHVPTFLLDGWMLVHGLD